MILLSGCLSKSAAGIAGLGLLLLRPVLAHGLLALGRGLLRLVEDDDVAVLGLELALASESRLTGLGCLTARSRHVPDHDELLHHRPDVRGEPVEHHAERE